MQKENPFCNWFFSFCYPQSPAIPSPALNVSGSHHFQTNALPAEKQLHYLKSELRLSVTHNSLKWTKDIWNTQRDTPRDNSLKENKASFQSKHPVVSPHNVSWHMTGRRWHVSSQVKKHSHVNYSFGIGGGGYQPHKHKISTYAKWSKEKSYLIFWFCSKLSPNFVKYDVIFWYYQHLFNPVFSSVFTTHTKKSFAKIYLGWTICMG